MGTRTWSRRGVLTAAGRRRAGLEVRNSTFSDIFPGGIQVPTENKKNPLDELYEQTAKVSPYTDTSVYNPELLSGVLQEMIKGGGKQIFQDTNGDDLADEVNEVRELMKNLNLNHENPNDCQIFADLLGMFVPAKGTNSDRTVTVKNNVVMIGNEFFGTTKLSPEGTGYAMVARQIAAAQEIAKRTGMNVEITVSAKNDYSLIGASVWPKLGYNFSMDEVPIEVKNNLAAMGFDTKKYSFISELMLDRNDKGVLGFDVWSPATINENFTLHGKTTVTATKSSLAEQITREYGKRKGFVKSQASEAMFNDAVLRDVWASLRRKD